MFVGLGPHDSLSDVVVAWWRVVFAELNLTCLHHGVPHQVVDQAAGSSDASPGVVPERRNQSVTLGALGKTTS
jgi:hypothetical protein